MADGGLDDSCPRGMLRDRLPADTPSGHFGDLSHGEAARRSPRLVEAAQPGTGGNPKRTPLELGQAGAGGIIAVMEGKVGLAIGRPCHFVVQDWVAPTQPQQF